MNAMSESLELQRLLPPDDFLNKQTLGHLSAISINAREFDKAEQSLEMELGW